MAARTISGFPSGASVSAYTRSSQLPSSSLSPPVPSGTAVETETAGTDGRVTFSSLADGTDYVASDGSRVVSFTTDVPAGTSVLHNGSPVANPDFVDVSETDLIAIGALGKSMADVKGDLLVATAADTIARLAAGADGTVLTADSTRTGGVRWSAATGGTTLAAADGGDPTSTYGAADFIDGGTP